MPLASGKTLGHYSIVAPLGAGAMGEVYRARDSRLGREVAVKVLPADKMSGDRLRRFLREASAAARLNHPNVVAIHDIGEHESVHFIVMEYIDGPALGAVIPPSGLDTPTALEYAKQIAGALAKAHDAGVVHRDLKPANIMLTRDGAIKVVDFGLSTFVSSGDADLTAETMPGTVLGTPSYMSPEQAGGRPTDARSDIFSFGVVLYEMLSGQRAFHRENPMATMAAILTQEPRPLRETAPRTPPDFERIVARCLRKEAEKRFQNATDLKLALEDVGAAATAITSTQAASAVKEETPSIAVLPFANLSGDKDNEYFSDGLAEEILNALTQIPGLRVIARASAFAFRGREHATAEIVEKLRVRSILQGSVRRAGNRVRVTAQLIDTADESQLWSERYDREMDDVFAIQDEVAHAIVEKLKVKLARPGERLVKAYTENQEAHSLYLKGIFNLSRYTPDELAKGGRFLDEAVAIDPGHAQAWVHLAEYHIHLAFSGGAPRPHLASAMDAAEHAINADPSLSAAHAALAITRGFYQFRWAEALAMIESSAHLPANPWHYVWGGVVMGANGRIEDAIRHVTRALDLDPLSSLARYLLAIYNLYLGRYEETCHFAKDTLEINKNMTGQLAILGLGLLNLGRIEEGVESLESALRVHPRLTAFAGYLGIAYVRAGRRADAERLLAQKLEQHKTEGGSPFALVLCALGLGDMTQTLKFLEIAIEEHDPWLGFMPGNPYFEPLRSDPRFIEIMKRVGLPNYV